MVSRGSDPLRIPAEFWLRDDVGQALEQRDIGTLFRLLGKHLGASQTRIGTATEMAQGTVCTIMNGGRVVTAIDVLDRIADGLAMPDASRLRLGLAPRGEPLPWNGSGKEDATNRRTALNLGLLAALSPETLRAVLRDSAGEALEFTRATSASSVGTGTLDHLEAVVTELNRSYSSEPPGEHFAVTRAYRQRVEQLIQGQHTLKEERELYVSAAWLSELLAWHAFEFGFPLAAEAYAIDCYEHADQAGHNELCAWAADAMAAIAIYAARPDKAITAAKKGIRKISDHHPLAVMLRAQAARAYARQGQRGACVELLTEAQELHERLPTQLPSRLSADTGIFVSQAVTSYPASSYLWLADYRKAETYARAALATYESAAPADRIPSPEAIAHIKLGTILVHLGSVDEAVAHGSQALNSVRVVNSVLSKAGELYQTLMTRFPEEPIAQSFHEQYRQLSTQASKERL